MSATPVVRPLTSMLGARVEGVDLRHEVDDDVADLLRQALRDHLVLVLPGQSLSTEEQIRFISLFAPPEPHPVNAFLGETQVSTVIEPDLIRVPVETVADPTDMGDYLAEFPGWHTDAAFCQWIPKVASLRAEIIPDIGGDTSWINLCAAYEALSPRMQSWLEDVDAVHVYGPQFKTNFDFSPYGEDAEQRFDAAHGPRSYPLVIEHPETGRRSLYLSPVYTAAIEGLSRNESRTLLRFLFRHITDQAFVFRHHWSIDDLVVWDELVTLHLAPQDFRPKPRRLIRVAGGRVTPAAPSRR